MVDKTLSKIEHLYSDNLADMGLTSEAVGWPDKEKQEMRFNKLSSIINSSQKKLEINDLGCGYGAHLNYLSNSLGLNISKYNGYDISVPMLEAAKSHLKHYCGSLNLLNSPNLNTVANYTFVSGTFNVKFEENRRLWEDYIKNHLLDMDKFSTDGFAFNLLTSHVDWMNQDLYYGDPGEWLEFCLKNFGSSVTLIHNYPLYEWTIHVNKR